MDRCRTVLLSVILLSGVLAAPAGAAIFYDIGVKGVYEDNVVGLLSDRTSSPTTVNAGKVLGAMGSGPGSGMGPGSGPGSYLGSSTEENSDLSIDITAEIGVSTRWGSNTSFLLSGGAERITYSEFTEFNMTAGGMTAGVIQQFGNWFAARITANGVVKRFDEEQARDATAYGGGMLLKQFLSSRFWLKESAGYERNEADAAFFTYTGTSLALGAGYAVTGRTTLHAGYSYLVRAYDEPEGFEETANVYWLGLDWELARNWFLGLQYDRRFSDSTLPETDTTGNIYSLGLRYSY
jgi:long-subunit fatty acid transport protein